MSVATRHGRGSSHRVTPPDLGLAAKSLAEGITKAVPALYKLQTALINDLPTSPIPDQFPTTRTKLKTEWAECKGLLRRCWIYAEVYVEFLTGSQDPSQGCVYLLPKAKGVYEAAILAKGNYEKLHKELQAYREKLESALRISVVRNNAVQPPRLSEGTVSTMSQTTLKWAHPDGPSSLTESYAALEQIYAALRDIVAFWTYHIEDLFSISSEAAWCRFKDILQGSMYSISAGADAIVINAAGAPRQQPNHAQPPRNSPSGGIFQAIWDIFKRRKKTS